MNSSYISSTISRSYLSSYLNRYLSRHLNRYLNSYLKQAFVSLFYIGLVFNLITLPAQSSELESEQDDLVVIVNPSMVDQSIPLRGLRATFGMRIAVWPDDTPVSVYVMDVDSKEHILFCQTVLRVLPYVLKRNWDRYLFSGTGHAPVIVKDFTEMKQSVAANPGAIGYIPRSYVDSSVAILEVK